MQRDLAGTLIAISGWACIGTTITNDFWKTSTVAGSVVTANTVYENLWTSCGTDSMGVSNCRDFDSLLNLPGFIQACRALVITAIILGFFASLLAFLGMQCTSLLAVDVATKGRITFAAGVIYIMEGLSELIAISWYATQVVNEFFDPLFPGTKYELGEALYVGWAGSALCVSGGLILCTVCFTNARSAAAG
ncbi:claudin-15-like [Lampetra fluviatilis]